MSNEAFACVKVDAPLAAHFAAMAVVVAAKDEAAAAFFYRRYGSATQSNL